MKIQCPDCGAKFRFDENQLKPGGVRVKCIACASVFRVYPPGQEPDAPRAEAPAAAQPPTGPLDFALFESSPKADDLFVAADDFGALDAPAASTDFGDLESAPSPPARPQAPMRQTPAAPRPTAEADFGGFGEGPGDENSLLIMPPSGAVSAKASAAVSSFDEDGVFGEARRGDLDLGDAPSIDQGSRPFDENLFGVESGALDLSASDSEPFADPFAAPPPVQRRPDPPRAASKPVPTPRPRPEPISAAATPDFEPRAELGAPTRDLRALDPAALGLGAAHAPASAPKPAKATEAAAPKKSDPVRWDPSAKRVEIPHAYRMLVEVEEEGEAADETEALNAFRRKQTSSDKGPSVRLHLNAFSQKRVRAGKSAQDFPARYIVGKALILGFTGACALIGLMMVAHGSDLLLRDYSLIGLIRGLLSF